MTCACFSVTYITFDAYAQEGTAGIFDAPEFVRISPFSALAACLQADAMRVYFA
jgi:hypothetical protein